MHPPCTARTLAPSAPHTSSRKHFAAGHPREVDDLAAALQGQHVIIEPNSPSRGVLVAFIEVSGAPAELMQIDHDTRPDL